MKNNTLSLMLHPVRMRILQALSAGRKLTVQDMMVRLPDIPQATLYRQLKSLVDAGLLTVVAENQVRGTIEKVYALKDAGVLTPAEIAQITPDEHIQYFFTYVSNMVAEFERFMRQVEDPMTGGWTYRQAKLYFSPEELRDFVKAYTELVVKATANEPDDNRKALTFYSILIPEGEKNHER